MAPAAGTTAAAPRRTGSPESPAAGGPRSRRRHPVLFSLWVVLVVLVALALILFLVLPTRTWLTQRSSIGDTSHRLDVLNQENEALAGRVAALQAPEEIERVARQQYGMVRPGEHAFSVVPAPSAQTLPAGWPYTVISGVLAARGIAVPVAPATTAPPAKLPAKAKSKPAKPTTPAKPPAATTAPRSATTAAPKPGNG